MDTNNFREALENAEDKLSIFSNVDILRKYRFTIRELLDCIRDFLSDEEKLTLFDYSHFQKLDAGIRSGIVKLVSDENILMNMLSQDRVTKDFQSYQILTILEEKSDAIKLQVLESPEILQKYQFANYDLQTLLQSLSEQTKETVLTNVDFITNGLKLEDYQIMNIVKELSNEEAKRNLLKILPLQGFQKVGIIKTFTNDAKLYALLENETFTRYDKMEILQTLEVQTLGRFLGEHREFCKENRIRPYQITHKLDEVKQKELVEKLDTFSLSLTEKKEILATLQPEVKQIVSIEHLSEEEKMALSIQTTPNSGLVILDLDRNLEDYRGLDELMVINAEEFTKEERDKFLQLCDICPELQVFNTISGIPIPSNAREYKEAEEWMDSILDNLNPNYSFLQKMAIIDHAIGKKVSYSPDYDTEVFDSADCRALWKIIASGYGVCNGIAKVEQYMLQRIGIESEMVSGHNHAFLKINSIELPQAGGEIVKGSTILDPTWNLAMQRFGGMPNNFCISYEQARKNDIDSEGKDHLCHKNDEELQDAVIGLEEKSLRELYTSVGLADKNGQFPLKQLIEASDQIDSRYANNPAKNMEEQLLLLKQACPEFCLCQNSSMSMLNTLLDTENLNLDRCVVNKVYHRQDQERRPVLYVYAESEELGKRFYYADKEKEQFIELPQEEFTKQFECYDRDLKQENGQRPWEIQKPEKEKIDLARSSGNVVAKEGEER